ncbi:MAG: hypothetical protein L0Z68_03250 [Gammaproteobacteria bacterium]|nr:hypothetical protein [Gammaproteobacteria bacterium]
MSYLGLTPSEYASGERPRRDHQGGPHPSRRAMIGTPPKVSRQLRLEGLPKAIQNISWKAQVRLCKRYRPLTARGKNLK